MSETPSVIEFSINDGATWHHGRTIEAWVRSDPAALGQQRKAVRENARERYGNVEHVVTRVMYETDPRCVNSQPPGQDAGDGQRMYTFDIVAVATFIIGAPDYATARRAAEGLEEFNVRDNAVSEGIDDPPGLTYELTCAAPRGKASFVGADPDDESIPAEDVQTFTEPLLEDTREALAGALDEADEALGGDSNDAEHDALYSIRDTIAGILGVTTDAPSPDC